MQHGYRWVVVFAFVLAAAVRLYFAFTAPLEPYQVTGKLSVYNDEPAHRSVVEYWVDYDRHPSRGVDPDKPLPMEPGDIVARTGEDFQPPLYYMVGSVVFRLGKLLRLPEPWIMVRCLSVLFGLIALYYVWLSVRLIGSHAESTAVLLFGGFLLSQVRFTSIVSNDSLLWAISAAVFYLILRRLGSEIRTRERVVLIVLLVAGLWVKLSFFPLVLVLPVAWLLTRRSERNAGFPVWELVIPLVCWIPWLVWNRVHWGEVFPVAVGFGAPTMPFQGVQRLVATGIYMLRSFWFPFDDIWGGEWRPVVFVVIGLVVVIILVLSVLEIIRRIEIRRIFPQVTPGSRIIGVSLLIFVLVLGSFVWLNLHYYQCEARLLFPAFTPIVFFLVLGSRRLISSNIGSWVLPGLAVFSYLVFL
jgi:hypothetical protein